MFDGMSCLQISMYIVLPLSFFCLTTCFSFRIKCFMVMIHLTVGWLGYRLSGHVDLYRGQEYRMPQML